MSLLCEGYDPEVCDSNFLANVGGVCWAESTIAALAYPDAVRPHMRALENKMKRAPKGKAVANVLRAILNVYDASENVPAAPCPVVAPTVLLYMEAAKFVGRRPAFGPGTGYNTFPAMRIMELLLASPRVAFETVKKDENHGVAARLADATAQVVVLNFSKSPYDVPTEVEGGWALVSCALVVGYREKKSPGHVASFLRCNHDPRLWILDSADARPARSHPRAALTFPLREETALRRSTSRTKTCERRPSTAKSACSCTRA